MPNQKARNHICEKAKQAFEQMDKDDSGAVSICEFREFCKTVPGMEGTAEAFCYIDTSDDQKISLEELDALLDKIPEGKIDEGHIRDLFKELDQSGDGKLNKAEFKQLLCNCDYDEATINSIMETIGGDDGLISLSEFVEAWSA